VTTSSEDRICAFSTIQLMNSPFRKRGKGSHLFLVEHVASSSLDDSSSDGDKGCFDQCNSDCNLETSKNGCIIVTLMTLLIIL